MNRAPGDDLEYAMITTFLLILVLTTYFSIALFIEKKIPELLLLMLSIGSQYEFHLFKNTIS